MNRQYWSSIGVFAALIVGLAFAGQALAEPVKAIVPQRLKIEVSGRQFQLPYVSNVPIDQANPRIDRAVIVIHGINRDADVYFESMMDAAKQTRDSEARTIIIAPQFLNQEDAASHRLPDEIPIWSGTSWAEGDDSRSTAKGKKGLSSYAAVDSIMEKVANEGIFPKLRSIVVAGHSAGGQFVQRYAAGNPLDEKLDQQRHIRVRYIVSNPSSYLYFSEERPVLGSVGKFAKPTAAQVKECPSYNDYRYGLEKLNPYMQAAGPDKLRAQYAQREVFYLLGSEDKDPDNSTLSKTCAAEMEGRQRLERGQLYHAYLRQFFGPGVAKLHRIQLVQGVGHNSLKMFNSPAGVRCIFEAPARGSRD